jgi:hypothetical protein
MKNLLNMNNGKLFNKYIKKNIKQGKVELNNNLLLKKNYKIKKIFFNNFINEIFFLFLINVYIKKKKIGKFLEFIPKLLLFKQRLNRTLIEIKKNYQNNFQIGNILKKRNLLFKLIYKNRLYFSK